MLAAVAPPPAFAFVLTLVFAYVLQPSLLSDDTSWLLSDDVA
jgi:hypothetical protein